MPREPESDERPANGERNVQDDDDDAAPVAKEDEHHESRQKGAEGAFGRQTLDRVGHRGRLVEFEADANVVGEDRLHLRKGVLDVTDHGERGRVGSLGDEDIDGPAAINERITRGDIACIEYGRHIPNVNRRIGTHANRDTSQFFHVANK